MDDIAVQVRAMKEQLASLLAEKKRRQEQNQLERYEPYSKQLEFHNAGLRYRERLFCAGNQLGKAQHIAEPILTPTGWRAIGDLSVGDEVIAGDGSITTVTAVYPQGIVPLFKLTFSWDTAIRTCGDHLWQCTLPAHRFPYRRSHGRNEANPLYGIQSIVTTRELAKRYERVVRPRGRVVMPYAGVAQFAAKPLPLDPYIMGVLLGDGCLRGGTVSFTSIDQEVADNVRAALPTGIKLSNYNADEWHLEREGQQRIDAATGRFIATNTVRQTMIELGLMGKLSYEKSVPDLYLHNGPDERLALLQGLMDTDGSVDNNGSLEFSSASQALSEAVAFLVQSFGGKTRITPRGTYYILPNGERKECRTSYRVAIRCPHVDLFRLTRKLKKVIRPTATCDEHVLHNVEPDGEGEAVCISVAHPSQLYVTRDGIVTHNTISGSRETAIHLTGRYPSWWRGRRFERPVRAWAGGVTGISTRDTVQKLLVGPPERIEDYGTGAIPGDCIIDYSSARGVPNALDSVTVRHSTGGVSTLLFKSYEQGREKWQGDTLDFAWGDEEPPLDIYTEALTRTNATGGMIFITFTPLLGMSSVVTRFLLPDPNDPGRVDRTVIQMTIADALHYSEEARAKIIAGYPPHEREARAKGVPVMGTGRVFPVSEESITVDPFVIPRHYAHIIGVDFGWDHPFAAAHLAYNRDADIVYVCKVIRVREQTPVQHAAAIRFWTDCSWAPVAWPHDGLQHDKGSGVSLATQYAQQNLNMLGEQAKFPDGGNGVEAGVIDMLDRMRTGRWKVFSTCREWFEEFRLYHREPKPNGASQIVKLRDDCLSASRYGCMMLRFADIEPLDYDEYDHRQARRTANSTTGY